MLNSMSRTDERKMVNELSAPKSNFLVSILFALLKKAGAAKNGRITGSTQS
jgi:hypothetical protein